MKQSKELKYKEQLNDFSWFREMINNECKLSSLSLSAKKSMKLYKIKKRNKGEEKRI